MAWFRKKRGHNILQARGGGLAVLSECDFKSEVFQSKLWYRGIASELSQFYALHDGHGQRGFWSQAAANGHIRKLHSGLPSIIIDTLCDITMGDLLNIKLENEADQALWDKIYADNNGARLFKKAVKQALCMGDGAFKISLDNNFANPIIEFYSAERLRYNYRRGRVSEVIFLSEISHDDNDYVLEEAYAHEGIFYRLLDHRGQAVSLKTLPQTAGLKDIGHNLGILLAIPLIFDDNPRHEGRGKSIYDGKSAIFDAIDEVLSQWIDALRDGRVQKYIPIGLIPRNPHNGRLMQHNTFASRYIQTEMDMSEGARNEIKVVQPDIDIGAFQNTMLHYMEMALAGIMAPETLGLDLKSRDNARAQREREKATLYTRSKIIMALRHSLTELIRAAICAHAAYFENKLRPADEVKPCIEFGEYAAPSFDSQLEAVAKGVQGGVMSIDNAVEQLYGNSWSANQKQEEAAKIKEERGWTEK